MRSLVSEARRGIIEEDRQSHNPLKVATLISRPPQYEIPRHGDAGRGGLP